MRSTNRIYLQLAEFAEWLHQLGLGFSIENPTNSILWCFFAWFVNFDACMHGSERLNHTSFLTNVEEFARLQAECDGLHQHKPWGFSGPPG